MDKVKTGNIIKEARLRKGYTQQELGEIVGVTNKAVSRWENAESYPDITMLDMLAATLDLSVEEIINGEKTTLSSTDMVKTEITLKEIFVKIIGSKIITRKTVIVSGLILLSLFCGLIQYKKYRADYPAGTVRSKVTANPSDFKIQKMRKEAELKKLLLKFDKNIIDTSIYLDDSEGEIVSANVVIFTKQEVTDQTQKEEMLSLISENLNIEKNNIAILYN